MPSSVVFRGGSERGVGRVAGVCAFASLAAMFGALAVANAGDAGRGVQPLGAARPGADSAAARMQRLVEFHDGSGHQALAVGLRALGLVLTIGVGVYLYWLVRRRRATPSRYVLWCAIGGPLLVAGATVFGYFAFGHVADAFFASGPRTAARASDLIDHDGPLRLAGVLDFATRVVFAAWVGLLSVHARRVGLFTTFLGYWGVGAAFALVLIPVGDAMYIGWLASMGFLALGYWPGGRPAAWGGTKQGDAATART
jgi:hypothetical protein